MDMHLNKEKLRQEREQRAWSQGHLAEVAGVSLRTVQRLERTGAASLESARALASAFDIPVAQLCEPALDAAPKSKPVPLRLLGPSLLSIILLLLGLVWRYQAVAEPLQIKLLISAQGEVLANANLLNEVGQMSETVVDNFKVQITSAQVDGGVFLSTKVYQARHDQFELVAQPGLICPDNESAAVSFKAANGDSYQLLFRAN